MHSILFGQKRMKFRNRASRSNKKVLRMACNVTWLDDILMKLAKSNPSLTYRTVTVLDLVGEPRRPNRLRSQV